MSKWKIANEKALEFFRSSSVEDPVRDTTDQLKEIDEVRRSFHLGNGIIFGNHAHALGDVAEEVVDREAPPSTGDNRRHLNQLRPDQICVYQARTMIYIAEYKSKRAEPSYRSIERVDGRFRDHAPKTSLVSLYRLLLSLHRPLVSLRSLQAARALGFLRR